MDKNGAGIKLPEKSNLAQIQIKENSKKPNLNTIVFKFGIWDFLQFIVQEFDFLSKISRINLLCQ